MKTLFTILLLAFFSILGSSKLQAQISTSTSPISGPTFQHTQLPTADLPISIVYRVLYQAQTPLNTPFQVLLSEYFNKNCKVTCISIQQNGDMTFLVEYGGGLTIATIADDF